MKRSHRLLSFCFFLSILIFFSFNSSAQQADSFVAFKEINTESINEIHLSTKAENWKYILDSLRFNGDEFLAIESASINGNSYSNASIGYVQQAEFKADQIQRSLWLDIDGSKVLKLARITKDPSLIREKLATKIYSHFMVVPQVAYSKVYVNKEFYGFLLIREQADAAFVKHYFGNQHASSTLKTKSVYSVEPHADCIKESYGSLLYESNKECLDFLFHGADKSNIHKLSQALKNDISNIEQILDVNSALWMLALNDVTMNFNSYNGFKSTNYYLVEDQFGRMNFVPFDFEMAFGAKKRVSSKSDFTLEQMAKLPLAYHLDNTKYPLIRKLLSNDLYFRTYISNCRAIMNAFYDDEVYLNLAKQYQADLVDAISEDPFLKAKSEKVKANLQYTVGKRSQIPGIEEIVEARRAFLKKETILKILGPEVMEFSFVSRERFSNVKIEDFVLSVETDRYTEAVKVHYRFSKKQAFISTNLMDDGQHQDQKAGDKVFGVRISPPDGYEDLEFYFELDNSKMKSFAPNNFDRKTFKASLKTLNE